MLIPPAVVSAAAARATPAAETTVTLKFGSVTAGGVLTVFVEVAKDRNAQGVPQEIVEQPYGTVVVPAGTGPVSLTIPVSRSELAAAQSGLATLDFRGTFGSVSLGSTQSVQVAPAPADPHASSSITTSPTGVVDYHDATPVVLTADPGTRPPTPSGSPPHPRTPHALTLRLLQRHRGG